MGRVAAATHPHCHQPEGAEQRADVTVTSVYPLGPPHKKPRQWGYDVPSSASPVERIRYWVARPYPVASDNLLVRVQNTLPGMSSPGNDVTVLPALHHNALAFRETSIVKNHSISLKASVLPCNDITSG